MMERGKKILILSSNYGNGHLQASLALQEEIGHLSPDSDVLITDILDSVYPRMNKFAQKFYLKSFTLYPTLYGWVYYQTREVDRYRWLKNRLNRFGIHEFEAFLQEYRPDLVVSTFPSHAGMMSSLRQKGVTRIPHYTVVTDYGFHSTWLHPQVDGYFVATEALKDEFVRRGVESSRVHVTGIPIRSKYKEKKDPLGLKRKYQFDLGRPVILVLAGAFGVMRNLDKTIRGLLHLPANPIVVVVCGKNRSLYRSLKKIGENGEGSLHVLGYTHQLNEWYQVADFVITKPGGLTVSEALWMECPMILHRPVPGQEMENAKYLSKLGVAYRTEQTEEIIGFAELLLREPHRLEGMREKARRAKGVQFASTVIATKLLEEKSLPDDQSLYGMIFS